MADNPKQLPWEQVAELSARLAAIPVFERVAPLSDESEVLRRFFAPVECEGKTVTDQLLARYRKADEHVQKLGDPSQVVALRSRMDLLLARVQTMDCCECAKTSGHTCGGNDEDKDDAQLTQPGLCIAVLHEMFADVVRRYAQVSREWAFEDKPDYGRDLDTYLSTRAKPESAYDRAGPDWKIGGATRFLDGPTGRTSEIRLSIGVDELDWPSFCSAFWILVHEFVCHAQQGRPGPEPREPCSKDCQFFEGWMDEIASRLVKADLDARCLASTTSTFVSQYDSRISEAASAFRFSRYGWAPSVARVKLAARWDAGVQAVDMVDKFLMTFAPPGAPPPDRDTLPALVRLSFRIAAHAPNPSLAGEIVAWLRSAPTVVWGLGEGAQGRLYDLLTQPISDFSIWVNELRVLAGLRDLVK